MGAAVTAERWHAVVAGATTVQLLAAHHTPAQLRRAAAIDTTTPAR